VALEISREVISVLNLSLVIGIFVSMKTTVYAVIYACQLNIMIVVPPIPMVIKLDLREITIEYWETMKAYRIC
jgi:hypothetical protein